MTPEQKIKARIEKNTGEEFFPSRNQSMTPRAGEDLDLILEYIDLQFESLRKRVAEGINYTLHGDKNADPDTINNVTNDMVSDMIITDQAVRGFASNTVTAQSDRLSFEEVHEYTVRDIMQDVAQTHWIYAAYINHADRLPDEAGIEFWFKVLYDGKEYRTGPEQARHQRMVRQSLVDGLRKEVASR